MLAYLVDIEGVVAALKVLADGLRGAALGDLLPLGPLLRRLRLHLGEKATQLRVLLVQLHPLPAHAAHLPQLAHEHAELGPLREGLPVGQARGGDGHLVQLVHARRQAGLCLRGLGRIRRTISLLREIRRLDNHLAELADARQDLTDKKCVEEGSVAKLSAKYEKALRSENNA